MAEVWKGFTGSEGYGIVLTVVTEVTMSSLAELVEGAAQARNDPPVAREYINEALRRIEAGQEEVSKYPITGKPSLKAAYEVAVRLESEASTKN